MSQKQHDFYDKLSAANGEANENAGLEVAAHQLDAVMDLPLMNTRAGLYIFLNSLVRMPTIQVYQMLMPHSSLHVRLRMIS
jgi:mediator of RNA polymerase II transcription subunit 5